MKNYLLILAGGMGKRIKTTSIPKQFVKLNDKPIIVLTIEKFLSYDKNLEIIVIINPQHITRWEKINAKYFPDNNIINIEGGAERFHSVKNGLACIKDEQGLVAIHDAVRPFVTEELIENCFTVALENDNAIPSITLNDSIRHLYKNTSTSVNRKEYKVIQTPQVFNIKNIKEAYEQDYEETFTDDAGVYEAHGHQINLIDGDYNNIKITRDIDLRLADMLINNF